MLQYSVDIVGVIGSSPTNPTALKLKGFRAFIFAKCLANVVLWKPMRIYAMSRTVDLQWIDVTTGNQKETIS